MKMASPAILVLTLTAMLASSVLAASSCSKADVTLVKGSGPINFGVIGDWGRLGAVKSVLPPSKGGFDTTGFCAENFGAKDKDIKEDTIGGISQLSVSRSMDRAAKYNKDAFIVNTGDNFYECGVDTPLRLDMDWNRVYGSCATKALAPLKWYSVIGNHDLPQNSVQAELDYDKIEPRWVLPCLYYAVDFENEQKDGSTISVRMAFINTNGFITSYNKTGSKYGGPALESMNTPEAIGEQLDWLDATLKASNADYKIVVGHHPMVSGSASVYGPFKDLINDPAVEFDAGMPDDKGTPSWNRLYDIINKYEVAVYFNGHDHIMTHAVDPIKPEEHKTIYVTSGAGSLGEKNDGCGVDRDYVKFVGAEFTNSSCANTEGTGYPGYNSVSIDDNGIRIRFAVLPDYTSDKTKWAHDAMYTK